MKTIGNNTRTVKLQSHFQRGGWVSRWDGSKFVKIAAAAENTYSGDGDDSKEVKLPEWFKGAIGEFHGVSAHTRQSSVELIGFTEQELTAPSPVQGWDIQGHGFKTESCHRLKNNGDYLKAIANDSLLLIPVGEGAIHPVSKNRLIEIPYEWGDQAANHFAVISPKAEIVCEACGCGDNTPQPFKGEKDWEFTSLREEQEREQHETNTRNNTAMKLGWSDEWREVANHIRSSYKISKEKKKGQNPLPSLRLKFPGTWAYIAEGAYKDCVPGEVRFTALPQANNETTNAPGRGYPDFWANVWDRWQVSYIPTK